MRRQLVVNGALFALALGTLALVWTTREAPTTAELRARKDKLLPSFRKDGVTRLSLSEAGRELELSRSPDQTDSGDFRIVKPWQERADIGTVNQLLGSLDLASALRPADGVSDAQAGLNARALRIQLETAGKSQVLRLGGPAPTPPGARYAEVTSAGASKRYVVSQGVAAELELPFDKFREPLLLEYGRHELSRITTGSGLATVTLDLGEHNTFHTLFHSAAELANPSATEPVLTALSRLRTEQFVEADEALQALGTSGDGVGLELVDKSIAPVRLILGSQCPKEPPLALALREQ